MAAEEAWREEQRAVWREEAELREEQREVWAEERTRERSGRRGARRTPPASANNRQHSL